MFMFLFPLGVLCVSGNVISAELQSVQSGGLNDWKATGGKFRVPVGFEAAREREMGTRYPISYWSR